MSSVLAAHLGMAAMRHVEDVVETTEDGQTGIQGCLRKDAEHLLGQGILGYAIIVAQCRLCRPADVHGGGDVVAAPVEDFLHLLPVESLHVLYGRVLGRVCIHLHQL